MSAVRATAMDLIDVGMQMDHLSTGSAAWGHAALIGVRWASGERTPEGSA